VREVAKPVPIFKILWILIIKFAFSAKKDLKNKEIRDKLDKI
jgi:hypothetical protein